MPPIESWHVARWITLFESQITGRLCLPSRLASYRSFVPSAATYIVLSFTSPFLLVHFVLHGGAGSVNGSSSAICHMPTQLRPSLFLFFTLSLPGSSNLISTTTKSIETVKHREIDGLIKSMLIGWIDTVCSYRIALLIVL